ncbi:MAG: aminotransferase class I/II-fold pyridoxal phosphate-dependent enzyme [Erysipelotrichaceae bacterium]|nr:aminotransferase class I/II-fold pyridoxal phosphate-dependent enzyme [Erysipelotrichaceae bacterium]
MDFNQLISKRLGGENFYKNSYYKFEKYSLLKKMWLENHFNETLLDFGIGESDEMPPFFVLDRLNKEIYKYENRVYADNGIDILKQTAAIHLREIYNLDVINPLKQINHVMGAKSALTLIPLAFINDNDIVISTTPGYEVLANMASWLNGKIYKAPLLKSNNYLPDLQAIPIEVYKKAKIFSINYPNNPTGAVANKKFYERLINLALQYDFLIVNDATYGVYTYKNQPLSIFSIKDAYKCCIEVHSFSKMFNMTGMRIGFIVADEHLIDIIKKVKDNVDSGQYIPIQLAASEAILNEMKFLSRQKDRYYKRMKKVSKILNKNHLPTNISPGTYYLYVPIPPSFSSADEFSRFLLDNCGIFTIPWDEIEPSIRLSMTFKCKTTEEEFYNTLDKRLKRIQ